MSEPRPAVVAETPRLRLREKRIEDARAEYAWRKDPEVSRYDATLPLILSYSDFVQQFARELQFANPTRHAYAIETVEGEHIGALMYYNADHSTGAAEYGISIGPAESRGAGLGTEATVAFLRFAWRALPPAAHLPAHARMERTRAPLLRAAPASAPPRPCAATTSASCAWRRSANGGCSGTAKGASPATPAPPRPATPKPQR